MGCNRTVLGSKALSRGRVRGAAKVVEKWRFENPIMAQCWPKSWAWNPSREETRASEELPAGEGLGTRS
jgi:hypothetical protein